MKEKPLGIFYLDYSDVSFPKSKRKLIMGYTKLDLLKKIEDTQIPIDYLCWLQECRTPGYLIQGNVTEIKNWINDHLSNNFGQVWL